MYTTSVTFFHFLCQIWWGRVDILQMLDLASLKKNHKHHSFNSLAAPSVSSCGEAPRWPLFPNPASLLRNTTHMNLWTQSSVCVCVCVCEYIFIRESAWAEQASFPAGVTLCRSLQDPSEVSASLCLRCSPWGKDIHRSGRWKEERMWCAIRRWLSDDGG